MQQSLEWEEHGSADPTVTFDAARERFLEDCRGRNKARTVSDYSRLLNRHFKFEGELRDVTRQQIMRVVSGLSERPSERSHAYVAIRTMMNWCVRHGLVEHSVVPTIKFGSNVRTRVLSEQELKTVLLRAAEIPFPFGPIVQLLLLTGQRRSEVGQLRRSWIADDMLVLPEGFAKNKREHRLPLTPLVRNVLDQIPSDSDYLFPAATNLDKPFSGWAWHKAKFDEVLEDVEAYRLHDLRRTFATVHAKIGTPIHVTERLLNHVTGAVSGVAAVYNQHSYLPEMKAAQVEYERYILDLTTGV